MNSFKTLARESEFLFKDKGSKFIGYAFPCFSEQEFKNQLAHLKMLHPNPTHICYAYQFGVKQPVYRANDDGEPNNSAGAPILGQIHSHELTNVFVAVVRYYGGTKLGVSGLINAYKTAAKEAISCNEIIEKELQEFFTFVVSYTDFPFVMRFLKSHKSDIIEQKQGNEVELKIGVKKADSELIENRLREFGSFSLIYHEIQK